MQAFDIVVQFCRHWTLYTSIAGTGHCNSVLQALDIVHQCCRHWALYTNTADTADSVYTILQAQDTVHQYCRHWALYTRLQALDTVHYIVSTEHGTPVLQALETFTSATGPWTLYTSTAVTRHCKSLMQAALDTDISTAGNRHCKSVVQALDTVHQYCEHWTLYTSTAGTGHRNRTNHSFDNTDTVRLH
jgi:hypothetical protein